MRGLLMGPAAIAAAASADCNGEPRGARIEPPAGRAGAARFSGGMPL